MQRKLILASSVLLAFSGAALGQQDTVQIQPLGNTSTSHITVRVVSHTVKAISYRNRGGATHVDFDGTNLMPRAAGEAKVESHSFGRTNIESRFEHMTSARDFGPQFLTYVLWGITPQGRPVNLGELVPNSDGRCGIKASTDLQSFGMIVTAEPYFAVTRPSDAVILENVPRADTKGAEVPIEAKFEALDRAGYTVSLPASELPAMTADRKTPLELLEARNAVAIARAAQAEQYAPDAFSKAHELLTRSEDARRDRASGKTIVTEARAATQSAEDARLLAIQNRQKAELASERNLAEQRTERAEQQATMAQEQAAVSQEQAEFQRGQAEQARREAAEDRAAAEEARQQAMQQQQAMAAEAERAQQESLTAEQRAARAEQDREHMRERLLAQLNQVLQTRDSARGLIVDMNDVLFAPGKTMLKPDAKIRLAKVAGIVEAYPDLRLQVEGYTDNTGSPEFNQELSERRAATVRDFLIAQGVPVNNVVARGFGPANPIASNDTPQGRQLNRRVDLVVSGPEIDTRAGFSSGQVGVTGGVSGAVSSESSVTVGAGSVGGTVAAPPAPPVEPR